jgi:hypothetical protein
LWLSPAKPHYPPIIADSEKQGKTGNERLRAALQDAALRPDDLAEIVEVDVKTVRRWLSGMAPYPRHRGRVARALDATEHDLWPELAAPRRSAPPSDLIAAYPNATDPAAPDPTALMRNASERIDLLDETLIHLLSIGGVPACLAGKAEQGVEIRILISEPDNPWINPAEGIRRRSDFDLDEDQDHHQDLETEAKQEQWLQANQQARNLLAPLLHKPGIELRVYLCPRYSTILRFDQQMLVTVNLWASATVDAPLLHLQHNTPDGIFDRFAEHYDRLWQDASLTIEPEPDAGGHQPQPASREPPLLGQPQAGNDTTPPSTGPRQQRSVPETIPDATRPRRWPRRPPNEPTGK